MGHSSWQATRKENGSTSSHFLRFCFLWMGSCRSKLPLKRFLQKLKSPGTQPQPSDCQPATGGRLSCLRLRGDSERRIRSGFGLPGLGKDLHVRCWTNGGGGCWGGGQVERGFSASANAHFLRKGLSVLSVGTEVPNKAGTHKNGRPIKTWLL